MRGCVMKNRIIFFIEITLLLLYGVGCKKEDNSKPEDIRQSENAIITFADPASDGCGWLIFIDDKEYHPVNLDEAYKVNGLQISIKYVLLPSEWECSPWRRKYEQIKIISISKR